MTHTFTNKKESAGAGTPVQVLGNEHMVITLCAQDTPALTVRVQGSMQDTVPNFDEAPSADNAWVYVATKSIETTDPIDGSIGIPFSGNGVEIIEVLTSSLRWLNVTTVAHKKGSLTSTLLASNNR